MGLLSDIKERIEDIEDKLDKVNILLNGFRIPFNFQDSIDKCDTKIDTLDIKVDFLKKRLDSMMVENTENKENIKTGWKEDLGKLFKHIEEMAEENLLNNTFMRGSEVKLTRYWDCYKIQVVFMESKLPFSINVSLRKASELELK